MMKCGNEEGKALTAEGIAQAGLDTRILGVERLPPLNLEDSGYRRKSLPF